MTAPSDAATDTAPAPKKRRRRYNWPRIKADYVEGIVGDDGKISWPTYEIVAQRNGALPQNVRTRAAAEHWTDERTAFQRRIETQRQDERSTELASLAADLDVNALRLAKNGMAITGARIQELGHQAQARADHIRQHEGRVTAETPRAPSTEELGVLSRAATTWYELGRQAVGDVPTQRIELSGQVQGELTVHERDEATLAVLAIFAEAGVLPDGVIDTRAVLDVAGPGALTAGHDTDTEVEPLHATDVGDTGEQEQEAAGVPVARRTA